MPIDHTLALELAAVVSGFILFYRYRRRRRTGLPVFFESRHLSVMGLDAFPKDARTLPPKSPAISRLRQLALDSGKAATFLPGRTLQVVFKPEIQKGFQRGTYTLMKTRQGETLADAISRSNGKIVGKGRLIQSGKVRQLASVSFQAVSIAVAQAHLAEIAEGMRALNAKLDSISNRLEANDVAEIRGSIDYVRSIAAFVHDHAPQALSSEMAMTLQITIRDSHTWLQKLLGHLAELVKEVYALEDLDTFGTGKTFEAINDILSRARVIADRRAFYGDFTSSVNMLTSYIDPKRTRFTQPQTTSHEWNQLMQTLTTELAKKANQFFKKDVVFNSQSTLSSRRSEVDKALNNLTNQRRNVDRRLGECTTLEHTLAALQGSDKPVRLALTFDAQGEVIEAGLLPADA